MKTFMHLWGGFKFKSDVRPSGPSCPAVDDAFWDQPNNKTQAAEDCMQQWDVTPRTHWPGLQCVIGGLWQTCPAAESDMFGRRFKPQHTLLTASLAAP